LLSSSGPPILTPDSACTDTYVETSYPVINKRPTQNPIHIHTADGGIMTSTHEAELDFPSLNAQARHVHVVPGLRGCSLLSIVRLCDSGYTVTFDKVTMRILHNGICIMHGERNPSNNLWKIVHESSVAPPPTFPHHQAQAAIGSPTTAELVAYAHATLFLSALSTIEQALAMGWIHNFPGLTTKTIRRHPPRSIPMVKGHLDQARKNQRSTKHPLPHSIPPDQSESGTPGPDINQVPPHLPTATDACYAAIFAPTGQVYSDQTGNFVVASSQGNTCSYSMITTLILFSQHPSKTEQQNASLRLTKLCTSDYVTLGASRNSNASTTSAQRS
jgi:hypothetical protein